MATAKTAWGIDIGQSALKALKLRNVDGQLQVDTFEIIEHPQILSQSDVDSRQLIRAAMETFLSRNNIGGSTVAVSVPGQTSLTRFVKLPPVEPKRIPDIVRFEAEQQIPFPIEEVIWRWQTFHDPDSPDVEVGIFAMKRSDVADSLEHFTDVSLKVDMVQMAPLSLYNFMVFDEQCGEEGATLLADIGANKTDLVVADGPRVWTRTIQIGGNNFTEALVRAFKLSFAKAEKLKRSAATSKYARQVFQAMRPVFADLVQEVQRSIGYYTSLHREARFKKLVGLGNGFRLPGLQKFLEQNLGVPVARIDSYNNLTLSSDANAPLFNENILSFAVAYGTAMQAMALAAVDTNLLPQEIVRERLWSKKRVWFAAAAGLILLALAGPLYRAYADLGALSKDDAVGQVRDIIRTMEKDRKEYMGLRDKGTLEVKQIDTYVQLYAYRDFWPSVQMVIFESIKAVATDQTAYAGLGRDLEKKQQLEATSATGSAKDKAAAAAALPALQAKIDRFVKKPRNRRKVVLIEKLEVFNYFKDIEKQDAAEILSGRSKPGDEAPGKDAKRGFAILLEARTPLSRDETNSMLTQLRQRVELLTEKKEEPAILAVKETLQSRRDVRHWKIGALNGGTAVLADGDAAYWVNRDGKVLAGNGTAATWSKGLEFAGAGIDINTITAAATVTAKELSKFPSISIVGKANDFAPPPTPATAVPGATGAAAPTDATGLNDPLLPNETIVNDTRFRVCWLVAIESDGLPDTKPRKDNP